MVDRLKDKDELRLEALFKSEPVPDLDFSRLVMKRVRRQIWFRRLIMPVAMIIGGSIALKPASELVVTFSRLIMALPADLTNVSANIPSLPVDWLPQMTTMVMFAAVAFVALIIIPALED